MSWTKLIVCAGIVVAASAYFLYTPIPDGYSSASARQLQMLIASRKVMGALVSCFCFTVARTFSFKISALFSIYSHVHCVKHSLKHSCFSVGRVM